MSISRAIPLGALIFILAGRASAAVLVDFDRASPPSFDLFETIRGMPGPDLGGALPHARPVAAAAERVVVASEGAAVVGWEDFASAISRSAVVYAGEQHDQALHHAVQLEVLKEAHRRAGRAVMGIEMVDITRQKVLDDFMAGRMSEDEFALFWKKAWGFAWELYRPLFVYAKESSIPVRALNAPSSVIRNIAKFGLAGLAPEERKLLPERVDPIVEPRYLAYVKKMINGHGQLDPAREARMLEAMAAWNETMGQSVVDVLSKGEGPVVVIAGMGHMLYRAGIGESVSRRAAVRQSFVLPYPLDDTTRPLPELLKELQDPGSEEISMADFFSLNPE
ncbi:MAG: ChaN family lipoprotein [Elusimicrobia bacterium]|nr:ChaN family lipoprotein [Elusimicrobiota bacterium]